MNKLDTSTPMDLGTPSPTLHIARRGGNKFNASGSVLFDGGSGRLEQREWSCELTYIGDNDSNYRSLDSWEVMDVVIK